MKVEGALLEMIAVPRLEIQPFCPLAAVPGAPVGDSERVQNSVVVPHCPQISQNAFKGHWLSFVRSVPAGVSGVPGTWGP